MSKFPMEGEFVKHVGLAPHRPVSGGKVLKNKRKKQKGTRTAEVLRNAATSLKHSRSALGAYYRRMARRKDSGVAIFATARKLGGLVYRMLRYGQQYVDLGQAEYEKRYEETRIRASRAQPINWAITSLNRRPYPPDSTRGSQMSLSIRARLGLLLVFSFLVFSALISAFSASLR